jgi:hypothetical protein
MSDEKRRVEEFLKEFTPRPAPQRLRSKVLATAEETKGREFALARFQWRAAVALGVLMAASLAGDAWFEGRSALAWRDLTSGNADIREAEAGSDRDLIREIAGEDRDLERQILSRLDAEMVLKRLSRPELGALLGDI